VIDLDRLLDDPELVQQELQAFAGEFLLLVSPSGDLVGASGFNILGYDVGAAEGRRITEYIHPDDLPKVFDLIERARRTPGFDERVQARARHNDGTWRIFDARVFDARLRSYLDGAVLRVRDITDEVQEQADADRATDRFSPLAEMVPFGILSADARGWVAFGNDAAGKIFDLSHDLLLGHGWERPVLDDDRADLRDAVAEALATGSSRQVTFRIVVGDFHRWAQAKFVPLRSEAGLATGWIATVEDVTDRHRVERELAHRATHDPLTKLPNRTLLEDRLAQAFGRLRREGSSVTLLFIDLDGFKEINDDHGHQTGDAVLVEVAGRLRKVIREIDTVARLGGDEFVAVCESLEPDEAEHIAQRVRDSIGSPMLVGDTALRVGASVGVTVSFDPEADVMGLLELADQAMYRNKVQRKARVVLDH
jgi:diguanylate cyclase (GGDEF)-like protein/PAS domain S-box-containing protein